MLRDADLRLRVKHGIPLLFVGVAAIAVAIFLLGNGVLQHATRVPVWLLALSIGVVALAGGILALVAGDFDPAGAPVGSNVPPPENRRLNLPAEAPSGRPAAGEIVVSRSAWERLNDLALQTVRRSKPIPPPVPAPALRAAPLAAPPPAPPPVQAPSKPSSSGAAPVSNAKPSLEEVFSDLEKLFREMDRGKPRVAPAAKAPIPTPRPFTPTVKEPASVPVPAVQTTATAQTVAKPTPWDESSVARKQIPTEAAKGQPKSGQGPAGVPNELAELLSEFYPDIRSRASPTAQRSPDPILLRESNCAGCGNKIGGMVGAFRCFRCTKAMCSPCAIRAGQAKRTLLCKNCFSAYGVQYPEA